LDNHGAASSTIRQRPQLVLDIGGVLATNLSPMLWQQLAAVSGIPETELYSVYKRQHSRRLWSGELTELQFWSWVCELVPAWTEQRGRELIGRCLQPLPALKQLAAWHRLADLHLLSNHLPIWVEPILAGHRERWSSVTISSEVGVSKPDPGIFEHVAAGLPAGSSVLFIDDQQHNLDQAATLGWQTLLADEQATWVDKVVTLLEGHGEAR
jgi:HAD superfamily hydrolase (TIGR01509 family)